MDNAIVTELNRIINESQITMEDMAFINVSTFESFFEKVKGIAEVHGATKGVLCPYDINYVFKIPFSQLHYDYCKLELATFEAAKKAHLDKYFASCDLITADNGIDLIVQESVDTFEDLGSVNDWEEYDVELRNSAYYKQDYYSVAEDMPEEWIGDFLYYYGEEEFDKLCDFLEANDINDIHSGNVGYIGKNPVIFDYAGWYE